MSPNRRDTIVVDHGPIFTFYFKVVGVLMIMFVILAPLRLEYGIGLLLISLILLALAITFLLAKRKFEISVAEKYYSSFVTFPGHRRRNKTAFDSIEFIFVNRTNLQSGGWQTGDVLYKAFLLFNDKSTVMMDSDKDKNVLLSRLKKYAEILDVEVIDNS